MKAGWGSAQGHKNHRATRSAPVAGDCRTPSQLTVAITNGRDTTIFGKWCQIYSGAYRSIGQERAAGAKLGTSSPVLLRNHPAQQDVAPVQQLNLTRQNLWKRENHRISCFPGCRSAWRRRPDNRAVGAHPALHPPESAHRPPQQSVLCNTTRYFDRAARVATASLSVGACIGRVLISPRK